MICPKCGFEQPDSPECMRCGVVVSRYKGPVFSGVAPGVSPPPPAPPPPPVASAMGTVFGDPVPAMAGATGTVYGGPASAVTRPPAFGVTRSFGAGAVLSETFSIYFSNFLPFALLTAIALAPLYLAQSFMIAQKTGGSPAAALSSAIVVILGALLCPQIATGAITYGVFEQMRGQDTSIGDCLGRGLSVLPRVLGLAIVQGIAIMFGLMACVIPGILLALRWAVAVPAAVTERTGVSGSLGRSTYLTDGFRGEVFSVLFVLGVLNFASIFLVRLVAAKNPTLNLTLLAVKDLFTVGLSATGSAVMYYRLRSAKESIDVDQIASVFS